MKAKEGARKDKKSAFGVFQAKWHILLRPGRYWFKEFTHNVMEFFLILYNMAVQEKEERDVHYPYVR